MKPLVLFILMISQMVFSYAKTPDLFAPVFQMPKNEAIPTQTQRDYTGYASESLDQFYSLILECVLDPDNQSVFLEDSRDYLDPNGRYVADLMGIFPRDEIFSLETYLSNIKMTYPYLLRNSEVVAQINTDKIEVTSATTRGKGIEVRVSYQVRFLVDQKEIYRGNSEATILYPNANNKYRSQMKNVQPSAYIRYKEAMLSGYNQERWTQMASVAMRHKDYALAKQFYEDLVQKGHQETLYDLAVLYREGRGTSPETNKAASLYKAYIERADLREGLISNQMRVLVKQPNSRGREIWRINSQVTERYCNALSFLAYFSQMNDDNTTALFYYRKLMYFRPSAVVYYNMGLIYANSEDQGTYDRALAKEFLEMSADLGHEKAKAALDRLNSANGSSLMGTRYQR